MELQRCQVNCIICDRLTRLVASSCPDAGLGVFHIDQWPSPLEAPTRWSKERLQAQCPSGHRALVPGRPFNTADGPICQPVASFWAWAATGSAAFLLCRRARAQEGACSME